MVDVIDAATFLVTAVGEGFATIVDTRLPGQPFTAGETIFPRMIIRNDGGTTDFLFARLRDVTIGQVLVEDFVELAPGASQGFVWEIIVPGPAGTHTWRWEAGHEEPPGTAKMDSSIDQSVSIRKSEGQLRFDAVTPSITFSKAPPFQIADLIQVGVQVINDGIGDNGFARVIDAGAVIGRVDAFVGAFLDVGRVSLSIPVTVVGPVGDHTWVIEIGHLE